MGFFDKVKEYGNAALEKSKELGKITKLNIEVSTLEAKVVDAKKSIGETVIKKGLYVDDDDVKAAVEDVKKYSDDIAAKKAEIAKIEEESKKAAEAKKAAENVVDTTAETVEETTTEG